MQNIAHLIVALTVISLLGLSGSPAVLADDSMGNASGLVFIPGKGYSWPPMGGPVTRYYYDAAGRSHLVEVNPYTLEVRRSPVDLNALEGYEGRILDR